MDWAVWGASAASDAMCTVEGCACGRLASRERGDSKRPSNKAGRTPTDGATGTYKAKTICTTRASFNLTPTAFLYRDCQCRSPRVVRHACMSCGDTVCVCCVCVCVCRTEPRWQRCHLRGRVMSGLGRWRQRGNVTTRTRAPAGECRGSIGGRMLRTYASLHGRHVRNPVGLRAPAAQSAVAACAVAYLFAIDLRLVVELLYYSVLVLLYYLVLST